MENVVICFLFTCFALSASQQFNNKRYRCDYEYNRRTNAFYKFHPELAHNRRADEVCQMEGARLMVIQSQLDVMQAHLMFKRYPDMEYAWVGADGQIHESAEEHPIIDLTPPITDYVDVSWRLDCDVVSHTGEILSHTCLRSLPFICKVGADDAFYDEKCLVYGRNYEFVSNTSSCYKIPQLACTWNEAYNECQAEGAHLVVINSEVEHQVVEHILKTSPAVNEAKATWFYFAGFRADKPVNNVTSRVFRTIFNQTLEEAGYSEWSTNEPNNARDEEYCGSLFKNDGKLNDLNCMDRFAFVCEKEIISSGP